MNTMGEDDCAKVLVNHESKEADFETAISATGFGKFNYLLLLVTLIASFANSFSTTTMSYVVPIAECDLSLSLTHKGMLNGAGYFGTLCGVFLWGFLADAYGRRKLQILGQLLDTFCNIGCLCSQTFSMLFIFKYLSGFTGSGPYTILMSYISEFHSTEYRSKIMVSAGVFMCIGNTFLPFIAWWILPMTINLNLYFVTINSWRLFLAICTLPPLFATIGHTLLPESPKFLMSTGKNEEAMDVFQNMYALNFNKNGNLYPIKTLKEEVRIAQPFKEKILHESEYKIANKNSFREGLKQMKTMFFPPFLFNFVLVNVLQFAVNMGSNTLRLWLPQFFTTMDEYQQKNNYTSNASLCDMLVSYQADKNKDNFTYIDYLDKECDVMQVDDQVYINSIIVSICGVLGYIFVGTLINMIGKKYLLVSTFAIASACGIGNYWSRSSIATLSFSSIFVTLGNICIQIIFAIIVELFPTSLRTMVISMTMIFGRIGAMMGNILFPILLEIDCLPPFLLISVVTLVGAIVSLFLPKKAPDFN